MSELEVHAMKTCGNPLCQQMLPLNQFSKDASKKDGHTRWCKTCEAKRVAVYQASHVEEKHQYNVAYRKANPEKLRQANVAYRKAHPEKKRKYNAAYDKARYEANRETILQRKADYRKAHPEEMRQQAAAYCLTHREILRKRHAANYSAHQEERRQYSLAYTKAHPEQHGQRAKTRRARKRGAPICDFTAAQWQLMKELHQHRCVYCGKPSQRLTQDHITPLSQGGSHTWENILPACRSCNSKKGTKTPLRPVQPMLALVI